jgi:hypothetical protein
LGAAKGRFWALPAPFPRKLISFQPIPVDPRSDRVRSGQYLPLNQNLCSANNEFCAFVKPDGIYIQRLEDDSGTLFYFKPDSKASISRLWLGLDGNLVLAGPNSVKVWESKTTNRETESALVMQGDGNLVLHGLKSGSWSSGSVVSLVLNERRERPPQLTNPVSRNQEPNRQAQWRRVPPSRPKSCIQKWSLVFEVHD